MLRNKAPMNERTGGHSAAQAMMTSPARLDLSLGRYLKGQSRMNDMQERDGLTIAWA